MSRQMKDSGVEWIGKIPEGWKITKIKYVVSHPLQYGASESGVEFQSTLPRYIRITDISAKNTLRDDGKMSLEYEAAKSFLLMDEDVLFARSGATVGKTFFYKKQFGEAAFAGYLIRASFNKKVIVPKFAFYNTLGANYESWKSNAFTQATIQNIGADKYNNYILTLPSIKEQQVISDFLDKKCSAIDDVLAKTQDSIEEYKKLKQAVITEAVTKGVRGKRPMKDSGIDWIGQIPKDWGVQKLKYQITFIESGVSVNAGQTEAEVNQVGVLKTSSVSKQVFDIHENKCVNLEEISRVECPVRANTIIVSRMNTPELVGACGYVEKDYDNIYLPDRLWQVHFIDKACVKFVYYWLTSANIRYYYSSLAVGTSSSMQNISQDQFYHAFIPSMDIIEQQEIADYLDKKCAAIDTLISKKQQFIEELTAYKKSLIYEYVTGKKEVPA